MLVDGAGRAGRDRSAWAWNKLLLVVASARSRELLALLGAEHSAAAVPWVRSYLTAIGTDFPFGYGGMSVAVLESRIRADMGDQSADVLIDCAAVLSAAEVNDDLTALREAVERAFALRPPAAMARLRALAIESLGPPPVYQRLVDPMAIHDDWECRFVIDNPPYSAEGIVNDVKSLVYAKRLAEVMTTLPLATRRGMLRGTGIRMARLR